MAVTPNDVRRDVPGADDVRIQARKIEFVNILVQADLGCEDESATVGVMKRANRLEKLMPPLVPRHEDTAVVCCTNLDSGKDISNRRPSEFLNRFLRA